MCIWRRSVFVIAAAGAFGWALGQQPIPTTPPLPPEPSTPSPRNDQQPTFRVRSDLVLIDLIATADGLFIPDLAKGEIEIREDGKKQDISYFEAVDLDQPAKTSPGMPALPETAQFAVVIDLGQLGPESRRNVVPAVREIVGGKLRAGDRVMLATIGRGGLRIRVPMTQNLEDVLSVTEAVLTTQDSMGRRDQPDQGVLNDIPKVDGGLASMIDGQIKESEFRSNQDAQRRQVADVSQALSLLSRYMRDLPGRKNVVFISDGYRLHAEGSNDRESQDAIPLRAAQVNFADELEPAIQAANAAQTSFYTVDPRGVGADDSLRALHTALARDTGGVAVFGTNSLDKGLEKAYEESKRYYRLAYSPKREPSPGTSHRIAIKVKRKGVDLRYRNAYTEPNPEELEKSDILNALSFPEVFSQFDLEVTTELEGNKLKLHTRIPTEQIAFRVENGQNVAELEFYAQLVDSSGAALQDELPLAKTYTLRFSDQQKTSIEVLTADHPLDLELASGVYRLTVAVRQPWAQRIAACSTTVEVP